MLSPGICRFALGHTRLMLIPERDETGSMDMRETRTDLAWAAAVLIRLHVWHPGQGLFGRAPI